MEPVQALFPDRHSILCPGDEKYRQTLEGSARRIEDMGLEVKNSAPPKTINLSETYFPTFRRSNHESYS